MAVCLVDCLASFHRCAFFFPPPEHRLRRLARKAGGASEAAAEENEEQAAARRRSPYHGHLVTSISGGCLGYASRQQAAAREQAAAACSCYEHGPVVLRVWGGWNSSGRCRRYQKLKQISSTDSVTRNRYLEPGDRDRLHHHRGDGAVVARRHLGDLDHDVDARLVDALAEDRVLGLARGEPVEEVVVHGVHEELAAARVGRAGVGHGERAGLVGELGGELVLDIAAA
eukprot:scaffold38138_cov63-Phaeocystis_antarctica.AAC.3